MAAFLEGFTQGQTQGQAVGFEEGKQAGYKTGFMEGKKAPAGRGTKRKRSEDRAAFECFVPQKKGGPVWKPYQPGIDEELKAKVLGDYITTNPRDPIMEVPLWTEKPADEADHKIVFRHHDEMKEIIAFAQQNPQSKMKPEVGQQVTVYHHKANVSRTVRLVPGNLYDESDDSGGE